MHPEHAIGTVTSELRHGMAALTWAGSLFLRPSSVLYWVLRKSLFRRDKPAPRFPLEIGGRRMVRRPFAKYRTHELASCPPAGPHVD